MASRATTASFNLSPRRWRPGGRFAGAVALVVLALTAAGCNNNDAAQATTDGPVDTPEAPQDALSADLTACTDPRPEMCTMDYNPVCGMHADGSRKTYSNGCSACTNAAVVGWSAGACE